MKIKTGFVTNSSSTCYLVDRRSLTSAELQAVRKNTQHLYPPAVWGITRISAYAEGKDILQYLNMLRMADPQSDMIPFIEKGISKVGLDNLIFVRCSDEGMGGYPLYLGIIEREAFSEIEYH